MKQLTHEEETALKDLVSILPSIGYAATEMRSITGADAKLTGLTLPGGAPFEPEIIYQFPVPVFNEVNHYRRLKRAYYANGLDGVNNYLAQYKN